MKNRNPAIKYILSFLLALAAVFCVSRHEAVASAAGADRIYYFNMDDKGLEGSMMLVESNGHWGLVDAGHTKAATITDASGRTYSTTVNGLSSQVYCRNGADVANYMINTLGVRHLDFIVGTHAHSDHVGGVPGVAAATYRDSSGRTMHLVDSTTTYYYKEYKHISDLEDDLVRYSSDSWHNQAFAYQAKVAMANQGAQLIDVSTSPQVVQGDPGNAYGDYITFNVGNMSFRLYNVHEQTNTGNENVNSIVTVMTNGNYTVVNLADINTNNGAIDKTSQAIAKDYGSVDVVVAGHHGYAGSNTKTMFDSLQPSFVVVPNGHGDSWLYTDCDLAAAMPYAQGLFGTKFYNLSISQYAVVTDLSGRQVYVYTVSGNGDLENAINKVIKQTNKTGWVSWIQTGGTLWSYLENGKSFKNDWKQIDGKMYYFDKTGIMQTGWIKQGGNSIRYTDSSGAMQTGWQLIGGKWYYFETGYGRMQKGWQQIDGKMYYLNEDGSMYTGWLDQGGKNVRYLIPGAGNMAVGWQTIGGKRYYFETDYGRLMKNAGWKQIDGKMYFFNSSGEAQVGWVNEGGNNIRYTDSNGAMTTGWQQVGGKWYYFETGYGRMQKGWQQINYKMFFFDGNGVMQTGWINEGGNNIRYTDSSGAMVTGWQRISGKLYYFETDFGRLQKQSGWIQVNGKMYYFNSNGEMQTGWVNEGGNNIRYTDSSGAMATGWQLINSKWYYFETDFGRMQTGWQQIDGKMYYLNEDGSMYTGWLDEGGNNVRYLELNSGHMVTGWQQIGGKMYYFEPDFGRLVSQNGWANIEGKMYYFIEGDMQTGWINEGGNNIRYTDSSGAMVTGWQLINSKWYYFETDFGRMQTGWQQIDGMMYYLNDDGSMHTGWITQGEKSRYLEPGTGHMLVGWQQIGGKWYYFETDYGVMLRNTTTPDGYYVNADGVWVQ